MRCTSRIVLSVVSLALIICGHDAFADSNYVANRFIPDPPMATPAERFIPTPQQVPPAQLADHANVFYPNPEKVVAVRNVPQPNYVAPPAYLDPYPPTVSPAPVVTPAEVVPSAERVVPNPVPPQPAQRFYP